jgi:hypothetical protein
VERPAGPGPHRCRQCERDPFPPVEAEGRHHGDESDGHREDRGDGQPDAEDGPPAGGLGSLEVRAVADALHGGDEIVDRDARILVPDGGLLRGEVDRRLDAVETVQGLLDARGACRAGHALELEAEGAHPLRTIPARGI